MKVFRTFTHITDHIIHSAHFFQSIINIELMWVLLLLLSSFFFVIFLIFFFRLLIIPLAVHLFPLLLLLLFCYLLSLLPHGFISNPDYWGLTQPPRSSLYYVRSFTKLPMTNPNPPWPPIWGLVLSCTLSWIVLCYFKYYLILLAEQGEKYIEDWNHLPIYFSVFTTIIRTMLGICPNEF